MRLRNVCLAELHPAVIGQVNLRLKRFRYRCSPILTNAVLNLGKSYAAKRRRA